MSDATQFRYALEWRTVGQDGAEREHATPVVFVGVDQLGAARASHADHCAGGWVTSVMRGPRVSALRAYQDGSVRHEVLAPGVDIDQPGEQLALHERYEP